MARIKKKLSRSILQEEKSRSIVMKIALLFLFFIFSAFILWSNKVLLNEVITARGEINSSEDTFSLQSATSGKVSRFFIKEREMIKKGQAVMELDSSILQLQIEEEQLNINSLVAQRELLVQELTIQEQLYSEKLTTLSEYLTIQRQVSDVQGKISLSLKRKERYQLMIRDSVLYSPVDGIIHGLTKIGEGSIIKTGDRICNIIPNEMEYKAHIIIPAERMGTIKKGQTVILKFDSYNFSLYGGMEAKLNEVSATTFLDEYSRPYYEGIVNLPRKYLNEKHQELTIYQGMTLNAEIRTGKKTLFDYLFIPIKTSRERSFNEP